jgi:hypothetical protein
LKNILPSKIVLTFHCLNELFYIMVTNKLQILSLHSLISKVFLNHQNIFFFSQKIRTILETKYHICLNLKNCRHFLNSVFYILQSKSPVLLPTLIHSQKNFATIYVVAPSRDFFISCKTCHRLLHTYINKYYI